ncbi:hypothetical protein V2A60_008699 [Cordyceps javanica]
MNQRPTTQIFVGDGSGQPKRAGDCHGDVPPLPAEKRRAPPGAVQRPRIAAKPIAARLAAATSLTTTPTTAKSTASQPGSEAVLPRAAAKEQVVAVRAPIEGDPWAKKYKKAYTILDFDGDATIAASDSRIALVRQFPDSDQRAVQYYLQLQHRNIVEVVEAFSSQNFLYIVMEEMTLCLYHLVRCPTYPNDAQLRSSLILDGLGFLHDTHLGYDRLRCRNVLVDRWGHMKLSRLVVTTQSRQQTLICEANLEKLRPLTSEIEKSDAASVGEVALYLMQKDAGPGVRDSAQWYEFLNFVACAPTAKGVAQLRRDSILANMPRNHEKQLATLVLAAEFRRLIRRRFLLGPWYICKVLALLLFLALNGAALSLQIRRTGTVTFSVLFTALSDATVRAKYLALLNLAVIYLSPHHYGLADVFGLSLQLFRQIHRVAGLLASCLILFPVVVALVDDPRSFTDTDEGRMGLMIIICMSAFVAASLVKPVAYEIFLKIHELSAAILAYLLLSQVLADASFNRLALYVYGGVSGLLNVFFLGRYGYNNFAGGRWPSLVYSEIGMSKIHGTWWLHMELKAPRRIHVKPGQYINVWIPGVQLLSSHPFATTVTDDEHRTVFHVFVQAESGMTKTLTRPILSSPRPAHDVEKKGVVVSLRKGKVVQTSQAIDPASFPPRIAFFTGPHGRSVDHKQFERVVLVASGCGYWCLDGYLEDMLRAEPGSTKTQKIVLVCKGTPSLMMQNAINQRLRADTPLLSTAVASEEKQRDDTSALVMEDAIGARPQKDGNTSDNSMKLRLRVMIYPADREERVADGKSGHVAKLDRKGKNKAKAERMGMPVTSNIDDADEVAGLRDDNAGRVSNLAKAPVLKDVVEDPSGVESGVKLTTSQSSFITDEDVDDIKESLPVNCVVYVSQDVFVVSDYVCDHVPCRITRSRPLPDVIPELQRRVPVENPEQQGRGQRPLILVYCLGQYAFKYVGRHFHCQKRLGKVQIGGPRAVDRSPPGQIAMERHSSWQKTVTEEDGVCRCMQQRALLSLYNNSPREVQAPRGRFRPSRGADKQVVSPRKTLRLKPHQSRYGTRRPLRFCCAGDCKHGDVRLERKRYSVHLYSRPAFPRAICYTLKPDNCHAFRECELQQHSKRIRALRCAPLAGKQFFDHFISFLSTFGIGFLDIVWAASANHAAGQHRLPRRDELPRCHSRRSYTGSPCTIQTVDMLLTT